MLKKFIVAANVWRHFHFSCRPVVLACMCGAHQMAFPISGSFHLVLVVCFSDSTTGCARFCHQSEPAARGPPLSSCCCLPGVAYSAGTAIKTLLFVCLFSSSHVCGDIIFVFIFHNHFVVSGDRCNMPNKS